MRLLNLQGHLHFKYHIALCCSRREKDRVKIGDLKGKERHEKKEEKEEKKNKEKKKKKKKKKKK